MRWLLRFFVWATVLAVPCWLLADTYHHALEAATLGTLGIRAAAASIPAPDVPASHVLGVFAAMCLASTRAPWKRRLGAVAAGVVGLVALEWLTGVAAIAWMMRDSGASGTAEFTARLRDNLTSLPAWIGAPVLWLALLGDRELPGAGARREAAGGAAPAGPRAGSPGGAR